MQRDPARGPPVVLAAGGHDPSGGAGIQADIETIVALGGQPVTLVTALTAQNTGLFATCTAVDGATLAQQAELLRQDLQFDAIKIGLLPSAGIASVIGSLLGTSAPCPVVLDPVLAAGAGRPIADDALMEGLRGLLQRVTVITPNSVEARRLTGENSLEAAAECLLKSGCPNVLITGTHESGVTVDNTLYTATRRTTWNWTRLPNTYHGSGCTLASALATLLARSLDIEAAATLAQEFTWLALRGGRQIGRGQWHPRRLSDERFAS